MKLFCQRISLKYLSVTSPNISRNKPILDNIRLVMVTTFSKKEIFLDIHTRSMKPFFPYGMHDKSYRKHNLCTTYNKSNYYKIN